MKIIVLMNQMFTCHTVCVIYTYYTDSIHPPIVSFIC